MLSFASSTSWKRVQFCYHVKNINAFWNDQSFTGFLVLSLSLNSKRDICISIFSVFIWFDFVYAINHDNEHTKRIVFNNSYIFSIYGSFRRQKRQSRMFYGLAIALYKIWWTQIFGNEGILHDMFSSAI